MVLGQEEAKHSIEEALTTFSSVHSGLDNLPPTNHLIKQVLSAPEEEGRTASLFMSYWLTILK